VTAWQIVFLTLIIGSDLYYHFVFDEGNFLYKDSFKIPYPVPFRLPLFRDWVKGWIDVTYLSNRLRILSGNKGTTFVLIKEDS
jgi:PAP_fibrillin